MSQALPHPSGAPASRPLTRGATVRYYRIQLRNQSAETVADACAISAGYLRLIENGRRAPRDPDLWLRLASHLQIPPVLLFGADLTSHDPPLADRADAAPPPPASRPPSARDLADEDDVLRAAWSLFYRGDSHTASVLIHRALQRLTRIGRGHPFVLHLVCRFHQLAGVLARDGGDGRTALHHTTIAVESARALDDVELLAAALFRKARVLIDLGQTTQAVTMSREALVLAPRCRVPLRGYLALHLADMLSRVGTAPIHLLDGYVAEAQRLLPAAERQPSDGSFTALTLGGTLHSWARMLVRADAPLDQCLQVIGEAQHAVGLHEVRWRVATGCTEVLIYARDGEVDAAVPQALDLLRSPALTASHRQTIRQGYQRLIAQHPTHRLVTELGAALQAVR